MNEAFAFLTCLGRARAPGRQAAAWFPVVGVVLGLLLGGLWWGAGRVWPPIVAAGLVVGADLALTGMLHFDGLVDAADGLLPHLSRDRRLAVMREPQAGAFGVTAAALALLLRASALTAMHPRPLILAGLWCASRSAMAVTMARVPYARTEGGLARDLISPGPATGIGLAGVVLGGALAAVQLHAGGSVAVAGLVVSFAGVIRLGRRRLGGFTGDVLGAAGVVGETVGLLVAAARW